MHSSISGHLGCVHILAIMYTAAMNRGMQISLWDLASISTGYSPGSGIAESNGNSTFNFLGNHHIVLYSSCTILHSHQQCTVPISLHPCQYLLFSVLEMFLKLYTSHPNMRCVVRWYLIVALICISLMISDVEHHFMCFLAIYSSSLEKCLFKSFAHFWIG